MELVTLKSISFQKRKQQSLEIKEKMRKTNNLYKIIYIYIIFKYLIKLHYIRNIEFILTTSKF